MNIQCTFCMFYSKSTQLKRRLNDAIASAMALLESEMDDIAPYALAIVTYALTVSNSSRAAEALEKLNHIAIKEGTFGKANCSRLSHL